MKHDVDEIDVSVVEICGFAYDLTQAEDREMFEIACQVVREQDCNFEIEVVL
jgi:hypothetical protein